MRSRRSRGSRPRPTTACGISGGRNGRPTAASLRSLIRTSFRPSSGRPLSLRSPSRCLFACPFRWPFVEEGNDTLTRVRGRDEFVHVNLLSSGQPFVKVNRIPRVNGLLGVGKRDGAQLAEFGERPVNN